MSPCPAALADQRLNYTLIVFGAEGSCHDHSLASKPGSDQAFLRMKPSLVALMQLVVEAALHVLASAFGVYFA